MTRQSLTPKVNKNNIEVMCYSGSSTHRKGDFSDTKSERFVMDKRVLYQLFINRSWHLVTRRRKSKMYIKDFIFYRSLIGRERINYPLLRVRTIKYCTIVLRSMRERQHGSNSTVVSLCFCKQQTHTYVNPTSSSLYLSFSPENSLFSFVSRVKPVFRLLPSWK